MIAPETYESNWIKAESKRLGNTGTDNLEISIYALSLLEQLAQTKLDFVFKGGTSLMLLFPEIKRLSTDIDIMTISPQGDIETILDQICGNSIFTRWEPDKKRNIPGSIPKAHYFIYFNSKVFNTEKRVLLDILFESPHNPEIIDKEIDLPILQQIGLPIKVKMLGINSLLGDKLTAFAPNTIGIQYNCNKDLGIVKQLYDIDLLFDAFTDISIVSDSFIYSAKKELSYIPGHILPIDEVFTDIYNTSFMLAYGFINIFINQADKSNYSAFDNGIKSLNTFIPGRKRFSKNYVLLAASKALYITSIIKTNKIAKFEYYNPKASIVEFPSPPEKKLNKLSKLNVGVLYYLKKSYDLVK